MPQVPSNNNGHKPQTTPAETLHFERTPVTCRRCGKEFEHFTIERIDNFVQLRCGDVLITEIEATCLHCGWTLNWDARRVFLEKMAIAYGQIVLKMSGYNPE